MNKLSVLIGLFVVILITGAIVVIVPPKVHAPTTPEATNTAPTSNAAEKKNIIVVHTPQPGSTVASPLTISGQARGYWFFEASFPYEIKNAQGVTIAEGPIQAESEWMTEDFVPFSTAITFPSQPAGSIGSLFLKKDNPSGLPENDDQLIVPIVF